MVATLSSLLEPVVIITTISGATIDHKVGITTTLGFSLEWSLSVAVFSG